MFWFLWCTNLAFNINTISISNCDVTHSYIHPVPFGVNKFISREMDWVSVSMLVYQRNRYKCNTFAWRHKIDFWFFFFSSKSDVMKIDIYFQMIQNFKKNVLFFSVFNWIQFRKRSEMKQTPQILCRQKTKKKRRRGESNWKTLLDDSKNTIFTNLAAIFFVYNWNTRHDKNSMDTFINVFTYSHSIII